MYISGGPFFLMVQFLVLYNLSQFALGHAYRQGNVINFNLEFYTIS